MSKNCLVLNMEIIKEKKHKNLPENLGYIPSFDGLRAFAIVLVIFAHANFQLFENGGVGVPVFFTLSGFLITTLLLEEYEKNNTISFKAFYVRRTFRLFPALYTLLLCTFIYAFFFNPMMFAKIIPEIIASSLYVYNLSYIWHVKDVMLYHTWSLGVEEQFYLIWPVVLYSLLRYSTLKIISNFLIFFILLFLINSSLNIFQNFTIYIIYSIFNVSIFIGCLVAILRWRGFFSVTIPVLLAASCVLAIFIIGVLPNKVSGAFNPSIHNALHYLVGIFTGVIILHFIYNRGGILNKLFGNQFMVFIGKISYSLYLWHLPVFKVFAMHSTLPPRISFVSKFIVSLILALCSWYIIEKKSTLFGRNLSKKISNNI